MPTRTIAALLLACLLPACDDPAAPEPAAVDLAFAIERPQTEPLFLVSEGDGRVSVRGYMTAPCHRFDGRAEAERSSRTLELRIIAVARPVPCFDAIHNYGYEATVRGLPAGEYRLRVVHAYTDSGWPDAEAFETQVRVQ